MKIGFIGLGNMGIEMARRLLAAGHELTVFNRSRAKAESLVASGARVAAHPKEAAANAEVVITMLADDTAVESCVFGEDGLLRGLKKGAVHLSMSTIGLALAERLEKEHEAIGVRLVGAPVFGRPDAAANGLLFIIAGGDEGAISVASPALQAMGQKVITVGSSAREAHLTKVLGNFMLITTIEAMAELLALARKAGLDAHKVVEALSGSLFSAPFYKNYGNMIVNETYVKSVGFAMPLALKDVSLALKASEQVKAPLPIASLLRDQVLSALGRGGAALDMSGLAKYAAENAGVGESTR